MRGELEAEQNCNILTPKQGFFPVLLGCSTGGLEAQALWEMVLITASSLQLQLLDRGSWGLTLLGAAFLYRILSPTDWTSCAPRYIIVRRIPSSCGRHKSHSFNPSTVKVISWYSSTGCTCYLHRCISYFDRLAGVTMLQMKFSLLPWDPELNPHYQMQMMSLCCSG